MRCRHIIVLFESLQFRLVAAGEAQNAVTVNAFRIAEVAEHLFDTPLAGSGRLARQCVAHVVCQSVKLGWLKVEKVQQVAIGYFADVVGVEIRVFVAVGTGNHKSSFEFRVSSRKRRIARIVPPLRGSGTFITAYPGLTPWATIVPPCGLRPLV